MNDLTIFHKESFITYMVQIFYSKNRIHIYQKASAYTTPEYTSIKKCSVIIKCSPIHTISNNIIITAYGSCDIGIKKAFFIIFFIAFSKQAINGNTNIHPHNKNMMIPATTIFIICRFNLIYVTAIYQSYPTIHPVPINRSQIIVLCLKF